MRAAARVLAVLAVAWAAATSAAEMRVFGPGSLESIRRAHAGRPFVLSFWSVHCEPCAREMPMWRELQARHPGVPVILVSTDGAGDLERMRAFLRRHDPGPAVLWRFGDEDEQRIRHAVDPRWRGELPRSYFHDAGHRVQAASGIPDARWVEAWFARVGAADRDPPPYPLPREGNGASPSPLGGGRGEGR